MEKEKYGNINRVYLRMTVGILYLCGSGKETI